MDRKTYEKLLLSNVVDSIKKKGGTDFLSSIILTGSFGRDEPTYIIDTNGNYELKSDIEIALIFTKFTAKRKINLLIREVSMEFEEDLNLMAISEARITKKYNFNFSIKTPRYKTLFTYDLFNGSKTIWGKDFISKNEITLEEVDLFEAKRLVANRIGELLYLLQTKKNLQEDYIRKQWKGKLMLAIASAWLICEKKYKSSYHEQFKIIEVHKQDIHNVLGNRFWEEYRNTFEFIRENSIEYEVSDDMLRKFVKKIDLFFKEKNICKPRTNCISRNIKYMIKYLKYYNQYGSLEIEDKILQSLITKYWQDNQTYIKDAICWHDVLY